MITLYGIKNCDTVQRALKSLDAAGIAYRFHDFKAEGLSQAQAQTWIDALGVDVIVNRKGTTWRKLDEATRDGMTAANAAALLASQPSLVKRPVIASGTWLHAGFSKTEADTILARLAA
jgi:arsenate reductase